MVSITYYYLSNLEMAAGWPRTVPVLPRRPQRVRAVGALAPDATWPPRPLAVPRLRPQPGRCESEANRDRR